VRSQVVRAEVSLRLHDPADLFPPWHPADEEFAKELARDALGIAIVETTGKDLHAVQYTRR
jgi:hypothetical protein